MSSSNGMASCGVWNWVDCPGWPFLCVQISGWSLWVTVGRAGCWTACAGGTLGAGPRKPPPVQVAESWLWDWASPSLERRAFPPASK